MFSRTKSQWRRTFLVGMVSGAIMLGGAALNRAAARTASGGVGAQAAPSGVEPSAGSGVGAGAGAGAGGAAVAAPGAPPGSGASGAEWKSGAGTAGQGAAVTGAAGAGSGTAATAAAALERIRAAYEYGDIDEVVEWSRRITEGGLRPTPQERAHALRYLGIGLFLTGRSEGAETAFFELLRLRTESRLDPTTTRPDVVAFFEQVRARHAQEIRVAARANRTKFFLWNFIPPIGQFQNGDRARAISVGAIELISLGTAAATYAWLGQNKHPGYTYDNPTQAKAVNIVNYVAVAVFVATYAFGVIDGIAHYGDTAEDEGPTPARNGPQLSLGPGFLGIHF